MKVLFLGSSQFSAVVLKKMLEEGVNVVGLITQPDRPCGRGHKLTPNNAKILAQANGIPCYCYDKMRNYQQEIEKIDFDISVVASFGQILPQWFLDFKLCINGDEKTGVTIMKVAMEVDSGDIILQEEYQMNGEYYLQLEHNLALIGGQMATKAVKSYMDNTIKLFKKHINFCFYCYKFILSMLCNRCFTKENSF